MKIAIYGGGCKSCKTLYENTKAAVKQINIDADIDYITDMSVIMNKGFMTMPVLEVDGKVLAKGKVLKEKEIIALLK